MWSPTYLMPLDIGPLYSKITDTDKERRVYGLIPLMASSSFGQIGALNAESFCERVLRCAGHVLADGGQYTPGSRGAGDARDSLHESQVHEVHARALQSSNDGHVWQDDRPRRGVGACRWWAGCGD